MLNLERVISVGMLVALAVGSIAGATIMLLLTDPLTVTSAVDTGDLAPLVLRLAGIIYETVADLLEYL